jgi:hypothetical protein
MFVRLDHFESAHLLALADTRGRVIADDTSDRLGKVGLFASVQVSFALTMRRDFLQVVQLGQSHRRGTRAFEAVHNGTSQLVVR